MIDSIAAHLDARQDGTPPQTRRPADGGQAYPVGPSSEGGLTKREWLLGQVLGGMCCGAYGRCDAPQELVGRALAVVDEAIRQLREGSSGVAEEARGPPPDPPW